VLIDEVTVHVRAGDGGNGCASFRYNKHLSRRKPEGGNGGNGGDVAFCASHSIRTLKDISLHPHIVAQRGTNGGGNSKRGKDAPAKVVDVPVGTIIWRDEKMLADFTQDNEKVIVAHGGRGGRGNGSLPRSYPGFPRVFEEGEKCEEVSLRLELRLLADVGIVGYPNAGKSSLIACLTRARPKIADYPFTTVEPNLGAIRYDEQDVIVADLPGLIKDAHLGKGLGIRFLKHIQRTRLLLHVVDITGYEGRPAVENINSLNEELKSYSKELATRPQLLVANKMDLPGTKQLLDTITGANFHATGVSCVTGTGIEELKEKIYEALKDL